MAKSSAYILVALITVGLAFAIVGAQPHRFRGSVTLNGNPAPNGILVVASIDGQDVAAAQTMSGSYGMTPGNRLDVPDPNDNREGKTIEFFILDVKVGEAIFHNGYSDVLDFTLDVQYCGDGVCTGSENNGNCPSDCPASPHPGGNGGSGGDGGGGGGAFIEEEPEEVVCTPSWSCTDWFDCVNGYQQRFCIDYNQCGSIEGKPSESRECKVPVPETYEDDTTSDFPLASSPDEASEGNDKAQESRSLLGILTGAVIGGAGGSIALVLFFLLLLAVVVVVYFRMRSK